MIRRVLTMLAALSLVVVAAAPVGAAKETAADRQRRERREQIRSELKTLREEVKEASAEEAALLGKLDDVQERRAELDADIADLDDRITEVQREIDRASILFDQLTAELVQSELKLEVAVQQELAAKNELRDRAVAAYIHRPDLSAAEMILRSGNLRELAAGRGYYHAVVARQRKILDRYTALKDETQAAREAVAVKRDAAKAQQDVIVEKRSKLEGVRAEHEAVRQQVLAEEAQKEAVLGEIRSRKAEFQAQILALQAESSAITQLLLGVQAGQIAIPAGSGRLGTPVPGARVTSVFGLRVHPIFQETRMHTGVDFGAAAGMPIRASADGVVVYAGMRGGYGNATIIDHGDSLATLYAHQSASNVAAGQRVVRGQVIGAVGCTGYCTGPHLHFEVRVGGTPVDPLPYL